MTLSRCYWPYLCRCSSSVPSALASRRLAKLRHGDVVWATWDNDPVTFGMCVISWNFQTVWIWSLSLWWLCLMVRACLRNNCVLVYVGVFPFGFIVYSPTRMTARMLLLTIMMMNVMRVIPLYVHCVWSGISSYRILEYVQAILIV